MEMKMPVAPVGPDPAASTGASSAGSDRITRAPLLSPSSSPMSSPPPKAGTGARLLLCSSVGTAAAAGLTAARWLVAETGEVLLLFSADSGDELLTFDGKTCRNDFAPPDFDPDLDLCVAPGNAAAALGGSLAAEVGRILVRMATSPHARAAPLVILFLSSTALVVGIFLTQKELQRCWQYGGECSKQMMKIMGVSNLDEFALKMKKKHDELKNLLANQIETSMQCIDGMVLDDILSKWIKSGAEFYMGTMGGIVLYSLPDEVFGESVNDARNTRRRLIRAADPSLEQIIFLPGGVWQALPPFFTESVARVSPTKMIQSNDSCRVENGGSQEETESSSIVSIDQHHADDDFVDNDDDSSDTPLASPVPADAVAAHKPQKYSIVEVVHGEVEDQAPVENSNAEGSIETVADALSATISDLVVTNIIGVKKHVMEHNASSSCREGDIASEQLSQRQDDHQQQQPPQLNVEKSLRRLTVATSFLFLVHLRLSPSTRRAWGSAAKIATSIGLASTAICTGLASVVLSSNEGAANALVNNPVASMLFSKILSEVTTSQVGDLSKRIRWMVDRLKEELRENKKVKAALAFMVLYSMRRSQNKCCRRPGTVNFARSLVR